MIASKEISVEGAFVQSMRFELAAEIGRVPEYVLPLDKSEEERAESLFLKGNFVDLHQHPYLQTERGDQLLEYLRTGKFTYGYKGLKHGRWNVVCAAVGDAKFGRWAHLRQRGDLPWLFEDMVNELGLMLADFHRNRRVVRVASDCEDIEKAIAGNVIAIIPTLEVLALDNVLDRVDVYHGLGIRMAGLTFTYRNLVGDGQSDRGDAGLSEFGLDVIERMNEVGMVIDLAHASLQTALDAIEHSKHPVVFSHAGSYTLRPTKRQRKDEEVKAMAEKDGVVGVLAVPNSLSDNREQGINDMLDHVDHFVDLVGADHVGVGTDIGFGDHVEFHRQLLAAIGKSGIVGSELAAPYMKGIESPSEGFNVVRGLVDRGYSDDEVVKIMGGNAMRVFRRVIG